MKAGRSLSKTTCRSEMDHARHADLRREIVAAGVVVDPLLGDLSQRFFGLNLTLAWPLPVPRHRYDRLGDQLSRLDPAAYVYVYDQTHITMMTLVNFKRHPAPSAAEIRERESLLPVLVQRAGGAIAKTAAGPFEVTLGRPLLTPSAVYLPVDDGGRSIGRLRENVAAALSDIPDLELNVPSIVHSTIMRFRSPLHDAETFMADFDAVAAGHEQWTGVIREVLLTAELGAYMRRGRILHRFPLKG